MAYTFKILRVADSAEWQPPADKPHGGAGPAVTGAWLARRVVVEVTPKGAHGRKPDGAGRTIAAPEVYEVLVADPVSDAKVQQAVKDQIGKLPAKHLLEGVDLSID